MQIVVLDGYTLNPGDLSWEPLKILGDAAIFERSRTNEVAARIGNAEIAITNKVEISRATMEKCPNLKYIGVTATGYNIVDIEAARQRKITVTNVPAYGTRSVAQMTLALLLELTNHTGHHAQTVSDGRWTRSLDFCYWDFPLVELHDKTMGIIGYGRIGQEVGKLARAFGMRILVNQRRKTPVPPSDASSVELEELLRMSDVISLHCPLTPETRQMINRDRLSLMKPSAFLLNTSRGQLINEQDLADALQQEKIAGAGLDVLSLEPPVETNPLLRAPNCFITPHIAWASKEARTRLMNVAVENLRAWLGGKAANVVSN
jgi:glycerate dehydrogenase